jgi:hypothetical protein
MTGITEAAIPIRAGRQAADELNQSLGLSAAFLPEETITSLFDLRKEISKLKLEGQERVQQITDIERARPFTERLIGALETLANVMEKVVEFGKLPAMGR